MKSYVVYIIMIMAFITSCNEENVENNSNTYEKEIEGLWILDEKHNDSHEVFDAIYFGPYDKYDNVSEGIYCVSKKHGWASDKRIQFEYIYDKSSGQISLIKQNEIISRLSISKLTKSYFIDDYGNDPIKYIKSELTNEFIILGEWLLHKMDNLSNQEMIRIRFNNDGTYQLIEGIFWSKGGINYEGNGNIQTGIYKITSDELILQGSSGLSGRYMIEGLTFNGMRLIKVDDPSAPIPYLVGGWYE